MALVQTAPLSWVAEQLGHTSTHEVEARYGRLRGDEKERMRSWMNASTLGETAKKTK